MAKEDQKQQASLAALASQGEERVLRQADEASQKRLANAIQKTAEEQYLKDQKELQL